MMILYVVVLTIEVVLLCLFVPSAAGGSIAGERERQDPGHSAVIKDDGKGDCYGQTAVLYQYGSAACCDKHSNFSGDIYVWRHAAGITLSVSSLCGFFILFAGSIGVFCSCRFKKTTYASISAYGLLIVLTIGTGLLVLLLNMVFGGGFGRFSVTASVSDISPVHTAAR